MKCGYIHSKRDQHPVRTLCSAFEISHAAYYRWHIREVSRRRQDDVKLLKIIRESHKKSNKTYGSRRVHADLQELNIRCGRKRVQRLMNNDGLVAVRARKRMRTTDSRHNHPNAIHRWDI